MTNIRPATEWLEGAQGIYSLPFATYLKARGASKSGLDKLARCPREYRLWQDGQLPDEQTPAMLMGKLFDAALLEDERNYHIRPDRRTDGSEWHGGAKECKDWLESHNDKPVISTADHNSITKAAAYVQSHPQASRLLSHGTAQVSLFAFDDESGFLLKGRPDWVNFEERYWVDVKRVSDASTCALSRQIVNYRWHVQAAMYRRLFRLLNVPMEKFYLVAVQACDWGNVNVRELRGPSIDMGEFELQDNLGLLEHCELTGSWPDYSGAEEIGAVTLPEWAYKPKGPMELEIGGRKVTV